MTVISMKKLSGVLSVLLKVLEIALLVCACLALLKLRSVSGDVQATVKSLNSTIGTVNGIGAKADDKLFNKGELFDIAKQTLLHADQITGETARIAKKQNKSTEEMNQQILAILGHADTSVQSFDTALKHITKDADEITKSANDVLGALQQDLETADGVLTATKKAIGDLDANLLNDPDIKQALKELAEVMHNVNGVTADTHRMTTDMAEKFHHLLTDKPSVKGRILLYLRLAYQVALIKATLGY